MEDVFNLEIQRSATSKWIYNSFDHELRTELDIFIWCANSYWCCNTAKYMNFVCAAKIDLQGNGLRPLKIANSKISIAQIPSAHLGFILWTAQQLWHGNGDPQVKMMKILVSTIHLQPWSMVDILVIYSFPRGYYYCENDKFPDFQGQNAAIWGDETPYISRWSSHLLTKGS